VSASVFEHAAHLADGLISVVSGPAADPGLLIPTVVYKEVWRVGTEAYFILENSM